MSRTATDVDTRALVIVSAISALGLLVGLLVGSAGPTTRGVPQVVRRTAAFRAIDFNDPATLAWSLQHAGPEAESLHEVSCSTDGRPVFVCHGVNPDGAEATVPVVVSIDGTSWVSR